MDDMTEAYYFYTSHDEDGIPELVIPDELLAGDDWRDDEEEF